MWTLHNNVLREYKLLLPTCNLLTNYTEHEVTSTRFSGDLGDLRDLHSVWPQQVPWPWHSLRHSGTLQHPTDADGLSLHDHLVRCAGNRRRDEGASVARWASLVYLGYIFPRALSDQQLCWLLYLHVCMSACARAWRCASGCVSPKKMWL